MRSNQAHLTGSPDFFVVDEQAKRYTLRDHGFTETKNGNFQFERPLSYKAKDRGAPRLKISISKDFTKLTMSTVAKNGIKKVDIFKNKEMGEARQVAQYILDEFVKKGILSKVAS